MGLRPGRIRVLVLAADESSGDGVRRRLDRIRELEVVGIVRSSDAAIARCGPARIDVLLAVSRASAAEARALQRAVAVRMRSPATRVVVAIENPKYLWPTLLERPDGLLAAAASTLEMGAVVGTVAAGHLAIGRSLREAFFRACVPSSEPDEMPRDELTSRELQIISGGARGLTSRQIANELHLAVNTVDKALTVIYRKLRAKNRTEACLIAARRGLLR